MVVKERKANRLKTCDLVGQYLNVYLDEIRRAPKEGKLVAYTNGAPIWFMLNAQDIVFVHGEGYGAFSSARKWERPMLETSAAEGITEEICSYSRAHYGCAMMSTRELLPENAVRESLLPTPKMTATVHSVCSTELLWSKAIAQLHNIPMFSVEVPYLQDMNDKKEYAKITLNHLKQFVAFIEEVSGRPYNWDRLQEIMSILKKAATLRMQCLNMGSRHVPAPGTFFDWAVSAGPVNYLAGRPETVGFYEQLKAEVEDRIAKNISAVPNEKHRILWEGIMLWPKVGRLSEKFAEANCAVVGGSYSHLGFWPYAEEIDVERPLESIATYLLDSGGMNWPPEVFLNHTVQFCKDNSIDGAVLAVPHTCRPVAGTLQMLGHSLVRNLGIPVVEFEGDHCDTNFYSDMRADYAIQALLEAMESRRRR